MLFDYFAVYFSGGASCIRFIGIDMHSGAEVFAYSDNNVAENKRTRCIELNADNLLVRNAEFFGILRGKVDMSFCCNAAFGYFDFSAGADKLAGRTAGDVAAFAYRSLHANRACVGKGKLNLICFADRSEDGNIFDGAFGSNYLDLFFACELTGLRKVFFYGEGMSFAEKCGERFCGHVYVSRGSFNEYFCHV